MASDDDKLLGKYLLKVKLGQGGMGVVYLATDTRLKRDVAIKVLSKELARNDDAVKRFLREARAAARLNHPNVVAVYDVDQQRGFCFLVMELVNGCSTADLLARGPLPWTEATRVIAEACRGLAAAHDAGLVHRDIKPSNIMRTNDGLVKLADFGLAKAVDDPHHAPNPLTKSGTILGTPHYMSPEQCRGETVDARSDLYSLGATYFALLTGQAPFPDAQPLQVMFAHCSKPTPDPRTLRADLPAECSAIVMKALAKNRSDRFGSAKEMLAALSQLLASAPTLELASAAVSRSDQMNAKEVTAAIPFVSGGQPTLISPDAEMTVVGDPESTSSLPRVMGGMSKRTTLTVVAGLAAVLLIGATWKFWPKTPNANDDRSGSQSGDDRSNSSEHAAASAPRATALEFVAEFPGLEVEVRCVAFSRDGKSLFTASRDGGVRQWSVADRKITREFLKAGARDDVHAVAASRRWLAAGGDDLTLWLWDLNADQPPMELSKLRHSIMSLAISPNGERLAVGTSNSIELFELDAKGGRRIAELTDSDERREMPAYMVHCVTFSADSQWLAAVSWNKAVGIWNAKTGHLHAARRDVVEHLMGIAFLPRDSGVIFGEGNDQGLFVWDFTRKDAPIQSLASSRQRSARSVAVTNHSIAFSNGEWDGDIRAYDIANGIDIGRFRQSTNMSVTNMAMSPDGRYIATCGGRGKNESGGYVQLWRLVPEKGE